MRSLHLVCALLFVGCATAGGPRSKPAARRSAQRVVEVGTGQGFACARLGSGKVRCWGGNDEGQLGDGTALERSTPRDVVGLDDAVSLSVHTVRACAVHEAGTVSCWGDSWLPGRMEPDRVPVQIPGINDARTVSVGNFHACAIRRGGAVSCWGSNQSAQLGSGATGGDDLVIEVPIDDVVAVAPAFQNTCAVKSDGSVWCWGDYPLQTDGSGEDPKPWLKPTRVETEYIFVDLHPGFGHYCGRIEEKGQVACFGAPLGLCSYGYRPTRQEQQGILLIPGVRDVVAMAGPDCALVGEDLLCWDDPSPAEPEHPDASPQCLGTRTTVGSPRDMSAVHGQGCVVDDEGVRCWGEGGRGQLGNGVLADEETPQRVVNLFEPDVPDVDWAQRLATEVPRDDLRGSALVWFDAPLFASVDAERPIGRRGKVVPRYSDRSAHFPVEVARDHGDVVEVHNLGARTRGQHCGWSGRDADKGLTVAGYDLTMFVRKADLVPVFVANYADSHEDGSVLMVAPGTPVEPGPQSLAVGVGSSTLRVYSEPSDLGLSYEVEPLEYPSSGLPDNCSTDVPARLLGQAFNLESLPYDMQWRCRIDEGDVPDTLRVVFHDPCVHVEVIVDENPRTTGGAGGIGMAGSGPKTRWTIEAGAPALWRDGSVAGEKRVRQTTTTPPKRVQGRLCWSLGDDFELCHAEADVRVDHVDPR
ncbi:MAG: hypothetical protein AAGA54_04820 [Myxococcota bacterium]